MSDQTADSSNLFLYNKDLKEFARQNRKTATKAEACLWKYVLRGKIRKGYGFRRQRPVLHYIADFICLELKLIIEVDGISHTWESVVGKDQRREQALLDAGFVVIRFKDDEVLSAINQVLEKIDETIDEIEKKKDRLGR
jgi:very-short-patch-repair endonuclease